MFREMRRNKQILPEEQVNAVLERNTNGVLGVNGDDGYPYAVPLSYVFYNGKIYFHSSKNGHKIESIEKDSKVTFTVIDEDTIVSSEYTTYFRSVIAFGKAYIVDCQEERLEAFRALAYKYSGEEPEEEREKEVNNCKAALIIGIEIEHMTGKEAIEYVRAKEEK